MSDDNNKNSKGGLDLSEKGRRNGKTISLNRRLFMQFHAFQGSIGIQSLINFLDEQNVKGVLYHNFNHPAGYGLLHFSESPDEILAHNRSWFSQSPFQKLTLQPEYTMVGRTYALGHERDLERALISRPIQRVTNPDLDWAIWYPVKRSGSFETLPQKEQRKMLMEHGGIGKAYGKAGLAHDIRLACHGMDKNDNDFVIGILGRELYPLSHLVQRMRKTKQTSQYLTNLGPFFVGKGIWQSPDQGDLSK